MLNGKQAIQNWINSPEWHNDFASASFLFTTFKSCIIKEQSN